MKNDGFDMIDLDVTANWVGLDVEKAIEEETLAEISKADEAKKASEALKTAVAEDVPAKENAQAGEASVKKTGAAYAKAYAESERNLEEMLSEYDMIGEDIPRREGRRKARPEAERRSHREEIRKCDRKKEAAKAVKEKKAKDKRPNRYAELMEKEASRKKGSKHNSSKAAAASSHRDAHDSSSRRESQASFGRRNEDSRRAVSSSRHEDPRRSGSRSTGRRGSDRDNKFIAFFKNLSGLDYIVGLTGVVVLVVAVITVNVYASAKANQAKVEEFASIGSDLAEIGVAGEGTLLAMAGNKSLPDIEDDFLTEYEENDVVTGTVTVSMQLSSVVKDLKIKFINKDSGKLVPGIEFEVSITDSKKKTYTEKDSDKDGIIYLTEFTPGETKVVMKAMDAAGDYVINEETQSIKVKETLDYKKIDVKNEIKSESQINAAKEDTAHKTETEAVLTDTVEWVASTKTPTGTVTTYTKVSSGDVVAPTAISKLELVNKLYYKLINIRTRDLNGVVYADENEPTVTPDPNQSADVTPSPTPTEEPSPSPAPPSPAPPSPTPAAAPSPTTVPSPSPTPTPTPTKAVKYNEGADLKDKSGNVLYIKSGDSYRKATAGDYLNNSKQDFYKQVTNASGYKYTGWQTIDGSTYFFTAAGEKVTGTQVIQGAQYTFGSDGVLQAGSGNLGIDVSKFNGNIDWTKVRNSGVTYTIIRSGYRGSTAGALVEDPKFRANIKGASAAGLKVGVYFFTQAVNEVEAVEEASMVLSQVSGYKISYPIFIDVESSGGRADGLDYATRTKVINAFCQTIRNSGYTAGVYANKTWLQKKFDPGQLGAYKIWLAQYNSTPTYTGRYNLWQYSSKGSVSGISGNVDMNLSYMGY